MSPTADHASPPVSSQTPTSRHHSGTPRERSTPRHHATLHGPLGTGAVSSPRDVKTAHPNSRERFRERRALQSVFAWSETKNRMERGMGALNLQAVLASPNTDRCGPAAAARGPCRF
jgi:hypothetical protein